MTRTHSEPGLGAQAAALTARIESSAGLLLSEQSRAVIHDVVLELLVRCANAEARLPEFMDDDELDNSFAKLDRLARDAHRDTGFAGPEDILALRDHISAKMRDLTELTKLATAVVELRNCAARDFATEQQEGAALDALAAYLRGPGGGT